ncbi:MAG: GNAT family N-acetyltransferase [Nostoc sp.]|uniref:GNAT family N-acetyltransferase n=1 Tax=Nostoc sp. TaxID=1180 RepID=UPI002FF50363
MSDCRAENAERRNRESFCLSFGTFFYLEVPHTPELGIWLKKSAHGHGFGREAIHVLKDWVDKNLEYNYLSYPVDKRNIPSRKIAESLRGKIFREFQQINKSGYLLDEVEYRIYK